LKFSATIELSGIFNWAFIIIVIVWNYKTNMV
jgi:hypothetical protein